MRYVSLTFMLMVAWLPLGAQSPVKKDIMSIIDNCARPPATVHEAFMKTVSKGKDGEVTCDPGRLFEPVKLEIKSVEAEYVSQAKNSPPGMQSDEMKKMADPELKKKMKSMTKEEKIKMAMEMMKSAPGAGAMEADPPQIRDALNEWQKINNGMPEEVERSAAEQREEIRIAEDNHKAHDEIRAWEEHEIRKLPQISSGEMSAPDPLLLKALNLKAADKHIALAEKQLREAGKRWNASAERIKSRYTPFYKKLVAADYASASRNFSARKVLSDAQMLILKDIASQVERSQKAYGEAALWQKHKDDIEKKQY